jgi:hypothetical protein
MDDDFHDDFGPRASMGELGDDEPLDPDDSFDVEPTIEGQFDDSDLDGEDLEEEEEEPEEQFEEDADEEMHDRGTSGTTLLRLRYSKSMLTLYKQKNHLHPSRPTSARSPPSHPGPSPPPSRAAASPPSATPPHPNTGNPTARNRTR